MTPLFFFQKIYDPQYIWDPPLLKKMPAPSPCYHLENADFAIILSIYTVGLFTLILQIFIFAEFSTLEGL